MVRRVFVEKKSGFDVEAQGLCSQFVKNLGISKVLGVRVVNRYDVDGVSDEMYGDAVKSVFSEPQLDTVTEESLTFSEDDFVFGSEYLPGQYDQRADSAVQCIRLFGTEDSPVVRYAKFVIVSSSAGLSDDEKALIKKYVINPVDSREASFEKPATLELDVHVPSSVEVIAGFKDYDDDAVDAFHAARGFAMTTEDLRFVRDYFKTEGRDPSITELRVIDTYWSDHCRHTTFNTKLDNIDFGEGIYGQLIQDSFEQYLAARIDYYGEERANTRDISFMDMGTICGKYLSKFGNLDNLDVSEEINACSIKVKAKIEYDDGEREEDWLVMFKNETHNHPTEIEPFGGAATCLGGAIRDPLSGRVYVYQAMRVTGAADPTVSLEETLPGKLSQYQIVRGASKGYSSYGNQIGLATGLVDEIYSPNYVAKRLEIGAVIGAAPAHHVVRHVPDPGDAVLIIGGRTGRDGIGGATGSSKEHDESSTSTAGAEVQKGNPPVERAIQRLFRRADVATRIKRCNDFGAGGVAVAIGELAESLDIDLSKVPKKYEGLDGTELAISESQERMAVVVDPVDIDLFIRYGSEDNLEVTHVADITDTGSVRMLWNGEVILDLKRAFLDTNGVTQVRDIKVEPRTLDFSQLEATAARRSDVATNKTKTSKDYLSLFNSLNVCSKKGLIENFDSTIGALSVLMPLGGKNQLTPTLGMAAKLPITEGKTDFSTLMTYGFDPDLSIASPYHGALYAVLDSVTKIVAMGGDYKEVRLTFQEYFKRLGTDKTRWAEPFEALQGSIKAQLALGLAAIGGKDSMSGTFTDIDVPPTLVSFAVGLAHASRVVSPELKNAKSKLVLVKQPVDEYNIPDFDKFKFHADRIYNLVEEGKVRSANTIGIGGIAAALAKASLGNEIGAIITDDFGLALDKPSYGSILFEMSPYIDYDLTLHGMNYKIIGETTKEQSIKLLSTTIQIADILKSYEEKLEGVFPTKVSDKKGNVVDNITYRKSAEKVKANITLKDVKPKVIIPTFPGTNCEVDTKIAFERAGADVTVLNLLNLNHDKLLESIEALKSAIDESQIVMIPGGFSGGDEPDGSAKFITAVFRNPLIRASVENLLD
ncbi:MAG: phosphoribosylformylglycinamidine synthase, partial [Clostridiales Family XIII bacterium]|nr:phosphoribosylformylglycinamidine synthase [Clostridiales Family XIII bacterium]